MSSPWIDSPLERDGTSTDRAQEGDKDGRGRADRMRERSCNYGRCCVPSPSRAAVAVPFGLISIHTGRSVPSWITSTNSIARAASRQRIVHSSSKRSSRTQHGRSVGRRGRPGFSSGHHRLSTPARRTPRGISQNPLSSFRDAATVPTVAREVAAIIPSRPDRILKPGNAPPVVDIFQKKCKKFKSRANQDMRRKIGLGRADPVHEIAKMDHSIDRGSAGKNQRAGGP